MSRRRRRAGEKSLWPLVLLLLIPIVLGGSCVMAARSIGGIDIGFGDSGPGSTLPPPPPPKDYGTAREIGTRGNDPNPRALFHGAFPSDSETQELRVGALPARFSGYTTWVRSVKRVPARALVDVYPGDYLRARVTVFNRDNAAQHVCACDFYVWTRDAGMREADAVAAPSVSLDSQMPSGTRRDGDVFLYVGTIPGPYFVVYNPDVHVPGHASSARGVWRVPA